MSTIEGLGPHDNSFDLWEAEFASTVHTAANHDDLSLYLEQKDDHPSPELLEETNRHIQTLINFAATNVSDEIHGVLLSYATDEFGAQTAEFHRLNTFGDPEAYRLDRDRLGNYTVTHTQDVPIDGTEDGFVRGSLRRSTKPLEPVVSTSTRGIKYKDKFMRTFPNGGVTVDKHDSMSVNGVKELRAEVTALSQHVMSVHPQSTEAQAEELYPAPHNSVEKPVKDGRFMRWLGRIITFGDEK